MSTANDIRETVRKRYAAAATRSATGEHEHISPADSAQVPCCESVETSCCETAPVGTTDEQGREVFGAQLYGADAAAGAPEAALTASLGCGVPTAVADLHPGEVVLDLGSGAGADVLISARRVAPGGRAIGLDMTQEMLELARGNAAAAGVDNAEFLQGYLEDIPLGNDSVDVVISNCVINLTADKNAVLAEAARVLRPGGRLAFSDVIADEDMDAGTKADMAEWTGCIGGALTQTEFTSALTTAGFTDVEIRFTHRVHAHAQAAIIRTSLGQASSRTRRSERNTMTTTQTSTIEVFDPAMCCSTGVCGPSVDPELARFEADLRWLATQGATVTRYNLAQEPGEFVSRPVVAAMLQSGGEDVLPIVLVDGKVRFSGTRPSRADLVAPLGIPVAVVAETPAARTDLLAPAHDPCCTPAPAGEACCTPTEKAATGCCASADQAATPQDATAGTCC